MKYMDKNMPIMVGIIVTVLIVGGYFVYKSMQPASQTAPVVTESIPSEATASTPATSTASTIKEFTVTGSSYKFDPATITVNKGDTVRITFNNSGGMHDLAIDEFKVKTKVLQSGESDTIEFVADQVGTFEYYCSVANHRAMGMKGNLVVN